MIRFALYMIFAMCVSQASGDNQGPYIAMGLFVIAAELAGISHDLTEGLKPKPDLTKPPDPK